MEEQEPSQKLNIILETFTDYSEAIAALEEQVALAAELNDNIASLAEAIQQYETSNNISIE